MYMGPTDQSYSPNLASNTNSNSATPLQFNQNQSAQTSPKTAVDYSAFSQKLLVNRIWLIMGIFGLVVIIISYFLFSHFSATDQTALSFLGVIGVIGGLVLAVVSLSLYAYKYHKAVVERLQLFLAANNWIWTNSRSFDNVATSLLGVGYGQRVKQEFSGEYRGLPMSTVIYEYVTGEGKNQRTHYFSDLHLTLRKPYPLVVLDDKKNSMLFFRDLPERIKGGQSLQLEGDFNSRFNLTVMPGSQQDVLQLLTPNFMAELMDCPSHADVELEANKLYLINHHGANSFNEQNLRMMFTMADVVIKNISEDSAVWQASSSAETIQAMANSALAARNETLLHPRRVTIASIVIAVVYVIYQIAVHAISHNS
jgi:hypothetical protein